MELLYYLWMDSIKGCGCVTAAKLVKKFGSAQSVYELDDLSALMEVDELYYETAFALATNKNLDTAKQITETVSQKNIPYLTLSDENYPQILREIHDPPSVLYYRGRNIFRGSAISIAVVGARKATPYGMSAAEAISSQLVKCGINIISGLASGIDTAAHKGAVTAKGTAVGVLGCGIDIVYPLSNRKLYESVLANDGMILTEFPPGTEPLSSNFPRRNRIISGLSYATLVVEAAENSGSLITAKFAAEQGREVYAVPGNITNPQSAGCNLLIKDGAKLVCCGNDILQDMFRIFRPIVKNETKELPELTDKEKDLYLTVTKGMQTTDQLAKELGWSVGMINSIVTMLELKGVITVEMGQIYLTY